MSSRANRFSGLSGSCLWVIFNSVQKLKRTINSEADPNNPTQPESFEQQVNETLSLLMSMLDGPQIWLELWNSFLLAHPLQSLTFSGMMEQSLINLNITYAGSLVLKPDFEVHAKAATALGWDKLWCSQNLYCHLSFLEGLIPRRVCQWSVNLCIALILCQTETSAHVWIDVFFFHVAAMLPADHHMVLNMEHAIPATSVSPSTFTGFINYSAIVADKIHACKSASLISTAQLIVSSSTLSGFSAP